jgi:uncharacterized protein
MVDMNVSMPPLPPLVISHSPCLDGFTAAWAMWLRYPDAEFVPGVYGQDPPDCTGRDVYLLDFSYKRPVMEKIALEARRVVVLDHHKTAEAELAGFAESFTPYQFVDVAIRFDMDKSGARLAWEYFHPGEEVPLFVRLVEDRDLWRFALPDSRELNAVFFSYDYDFEQWNALNRQLKSAAGYAVLADAGRAILRKQDKDVRELVGKTSVVRRIGGTMVPCANLPYTLASDAGNLMALDAPFAATWWADAAGWFNFSLRSFEGGYDVSDVAKTYGGGGHKHAAGFRVKSLEEL